MVWFSFRGAHCESKELGLADFQKERLCVSTRFVLQAVKPNCFSLLSTTEGTGAAVMQQSEAPPEFLANFDAYSGASLYCNIRC
jgi:hypothetical protein